MYIIVVLYTSIMCMYAYIYSFTQVYLSYRKFTKLTEIVSLESSITIKEIETMVLNLPIKTT